jgi:hypothetical protein
MIRLAAFLATCAALLAPVPAAAAERSFSITSFDRIRVDGPFKVTLKTGVAPYATASGSAGALDRVSVSVQGRTLVVSSSASSWGGYPGESVGAAEVVLGTHDLSQAWLNGSGTLDIQRVRGLSFGLDVQGSGSVSIANVDVDQLKIGLNGSGSATLSGKAPRLTAVVRGVSSLDAAGLQSRDAAVGAEGPSQVKVNATGTARIEARGTANVLLSGSPACTVSAQGSAVVTGCR